MQASGSSQVEEYSLKALESLIQFVRRTPLTESRAADEIRGAGLELGRTEDVPDIIQTDRSKAITRRSLFTIALREWLEGERQKLGMTEVIPKAGPW